MNNAGIDGYLQTPGPHDPENLDSWHKVHAVNSGGVALSCEDAICTFELSRFFHIFLLEDWGLLHHTNC